MALDRRWILRPGGVGDTDNAVAIWVGRTTRTSLVATFDADFGVPVSNAVIRTRWRSDIGIQSVLVDNLNRVWRISEIAEVGRRRFLDLAATSYYVSPAGIVTPRELPTTELYANQPRYSMAKDGTTIQNFIIANPVRVASHLVTFSLVNDGAAGVFPSTLRMRFGADGQVFYGITGIVRNSLTIVEGFDSTIAASDTLIPTNDGEGNAQLIGGVRDREQFVTIELPAPGDYVRILSNEEIPSG